ncbi:MAG: class I SAM-dependent methyltransferase [Caulobacterales bacterium]|uniref:class I SAM-dependent methyltransferase n=1 Tax=Glycocaulis sp. TaxID=1969725 RepID=UPI003FA157E0
MASLPGEAAFDPAARIAANLRARIASQGPLPISVFMMEALFDPMAGFYATRDPIGAGADFVTAPEISQMFGELLGLWAAQSWQDMGSPESLVLAELGPGRGTMMSDMLRAARAVPGFAVALKVSLVEASAALKMVQGQTLSRSAMPVGWAKSIETLPAGPALIFANEFLDCLPVRQLVRTDGQWRERCVGPHPEDEDRLAFVTGPVVPDDDPFIPPDLADSPDGALIELRPGDAQVIDALAARFAVSPGHALFIDYGPDRSEAGDTLQAIRAHEKVDPLDAPGTADLTAHVDFAMLARLARTAGLSVHGPVEQGAFLRGLGIEQRAAALGAARPDQRGVIARQLHRLVDRAEMGALFKVMAISAPGMPAPPGLPANAA